MAKVLNQNDIVNIIKQQTYNTNEIINVVYNNSAKGLKEITSSKMKTIKKISKWFWNRKIPPLLTVALNAAAVFSAPSAFSSFRPILSS